MVKAITVDTQQGWGWKIAAYLFLMGTGTGTSLAGFFFGLYYPELLKLPGDGALPGLALVIIGLLFLAGDLGRKSSVFLAFSRPGASWISRGIIIIAVFIVLSVVYIGVGIWLEGASGLRLILGSLIAFFALLTLLYTGLALGAVRSVPLWNPFYVSGLFLLSGVSTGIMVLALYHLVAGSSAGLVLLARYDALIIIIEAFVIVIYLYGKYHAISARGNLAVMFWIGVVAVGLAFPLALEIYLAYLSTASLLIALVLRALVCVAGLCGGFMLRYIVVAGRTSVPLNVNGISVTFPISRIKIFR